ncbi:MULTISPECIES: hypothetical protein [unclassified Cellvibrio]|uniref:hypothetical protein n=1 Tax=unclassified Cellvibrio TaxID=2624793 RepID=UPI001245E119|nr:MULTISPECIES: hypothetical protein [unclassified Cellvibrio]QEY13349.1 hypothetical protein D0B88_14500 [Cellvibrio sp. KY-YJ-3]UUA73310.1 hypothetical protein NNX04_02390 [Cellvibrio sp. QJXJ]
MHTPERNEQAPEATQPQERVSSSADQPAANWEADVAQTVQLGEQLIGFAGGVIDLARTEALLAVHTLPKVMMLWLIMMPIILLTWCSFSALVAWSVVALSEQLGLGMLTFFLLQVLLLFVCRWLFVKYRARMTFPYTRAHIDNFVRSTKNEFSRRSETKE